MKFDINDLKFNENGLIPAIVQDINTKDVLMMAWMNEEALRKTIDSSETWFYSRSRKKLWHKGETSGHVQKVHKIFYDCDKDTLLIMVEQKGSGACHEGYSSCFHYLIDKEGVKIKGEKKFDPSAVYDESKESALARYRETDVEKSCSVINDLYEIIKQRKQKMPEGSYTAYLFEKGVDKICKKIGEEAAEVIIAAKNNNNEEITYEMADLIYHLLVLMVNQNLELDEVFEELNRRKK